jgi:hypothetical protein
VTPETAFWRAFVYDPAEDRWRLAPGLDPMAVLDVAVAKAAADRAAVAAAIGGDVAGDPRATDVAGPAIITCSEALLLPWRAGRKVLRTIYAHNRDGVERLIGYAAAPGIADLIVREHNTAGMVDAGPADLLWIPAGEWGLQVVAVDPDTRDPVHPIAVMDSTALASLVSLHHNRPA